MSDFDDLEGAPLPDEVVTSETESETPQEEQEETAPEAEADTSTEEEAETESEDSDVEPTESKSQRKRRMRREREAAKDRELATAEQRISQLTAKIEELQAPDYTKYNNPDDYTADRAAFAAQQQLLKQDAEQARQEAERAKTDVAAAQMDAVREVFEEGVAAHEDFQQVVANPALALPESVLRASVEADNSADVLYYLGKNPDEARRIAGLSAVAQAVEVGRVSTRLSTPKPKTTKAPPPVKQVRGSKGQFEKSHENMSNEEYRAWRSKGGGK